jgi:hypothetical protein
MAGKSKRLLAAEKAMVKVDKEFDILWDAARKAERECGEAEADTPAEEKAEAVQKAAQAAFEAKRQEWIAISAEYDAARKAEAEA